MKIGIVGAGAIGGCIGTKLIQRGEHEVSVLARGKTLDALTENGWRLLSPTGTMTVPVRACGDPAKIGVQDILIVAVKGHSLPGLAPALVPMIGPSTLIVPAMNGVPWWFCQLPPVRPAFSLKSVDPDGALARCFPLSQTLGCAVHISANCASPGVIRHTARWELILGEPSGDLSARVKRVGECLSSAGLSIKLSSDIRGDIWYKLWGNLTMNPVSAITGATADRILDDPLVREFCSAVMREATEIGARIGCRISQQPEDRHAVTRSLGPFKTSMLQDVEAGRAIELDSIVGAAYEIGQTLGVQTPNIGAMLGLTRLFGRVRGLYPES